MRLLCLPVCVREPARVRSRRRRNEPVRVGGGGGGKACRSEGGRRETNKPPKTNTRGPHMSRAMHKEIALIRNKSMCVIASKRGDGKRKRVRNQKKDGKRRTNTQKKTCMPSPPRLKHLCACMMGLRGMRASAYVATEKREEWEEVRTSCSEKIGNM